MAFETDEKTFDFSLDPLIQFEREFTRATALINKDPNAFSLATVSAKGRPAVRTVLYKGLIRGGLSFFTNYQSPKSKDLLANAQVSALFYWPSMDQQIRIEGVAKQLTRSESVDYFSSRPRLSQIGAWSSDQSEIIPDNQYLLAKVKEIEERFDKQEVPCPPHWGGWHILPLRIEFWYARMGRLHERFRYERTQVESSDWLRVRLSP